MLAFVWINIYIYLNCYNQRVASKLSAAGVIICSSMKGCGHIMIMKIHSNMAMLNYWKSSLFLHLRGFELLSSSFQHLEQPLWGRKTPRCPFPSRQPQIRCLSLVGKVDFPSWNLIIKKCPHLSCLRVEPGPLFSSGNHLPTLKNNHPQSS